ncbi:MAG TPA: hypothetical protein H9838_03175 [Candidatus Acutalibacter pullistercoris]|uniref:Uncharacterized protein n=1 Tax=Candidatus Acutalibacter pullistercoris TaxID=2838418 RepID=A0A9D2C0L6_9FIRM|nr:hypothetical protein [Candidatus Acutalibacter pullistercoris]
MAEHRDFTLEDILAEQRRAREEQEAPKEEAQAPAAPQEEPAEPQPQREPEPESEAEDLNAYAGAVELSQEPEEEAPGRKQKKKKKRGLFGRKKKTPDFDESEDVYYGIQLKPIDEYSQGYDGATGEFTPPEDSYKSLFDDSKKAIDDQVEQNFQKLQKERRRRVAQAVQNAGVDEEQIADEFGVVAPMPVTAFAADPYAKQHGIEVEGVGNQQALPEIQKAMLETSTDKTMEIKLNVMNDTVELQRVKDMPAVSEESVEKILSTAGEQRAQELEDIPQEVEAAQPVEEAPLLEQAPPAQAEAGDMEEISSGEPLPVPELQEVAQQARAAAAGKAQEPVSQDTAVVEEPTVVLNRPLGEIPQVASVFEYRSRSIPTHVIHTDVLQSALLSEEEELRQAAEGGKKGLLRRRVRNKKLEEPGEEAAPAADQDTGESIEDYTSPEDAKSISFELRGDMRELSMRMMITGVCTALLALVNLIFGGQFAAGGDAGQKPVVYVILSVILLGVAVGVCYRTIGNGLKALFAFNANSDSAAAVAAVAVGVQTLLSVFFPRELVDGELHLYGVLLAAILFVNSAGKLCMLRRIHSNFRFVTSREDKYSLRLYDDYNTSLKMAKDAVAEKPVIAYQCRAGFLKRFLELSYTPDPSESASQVLAPMGLIASLVLCIACLLITRSVPTALSAFAAACCACVAVANMAAVNLPISRLCKTARRAGAMVVGYEAVDRLGDVNAVLVDAEELFPRGTVVLGGIKTFGDRAGAEEAIMAASALMRETGGPLSGVFDQVISENEDALPQVEDFTYEDGGGIVGQVDGKTVYIGSRALLINHHIEVPAREEESQFTAGNKSVIYIAVGGSIAALLVLTYTADRRRKNELQRLEDSGVSILVRTTDPNVTGALVSRLFGIDAASVSVLEGQTAATAQQLLEGTVARADALAATKGRVESMMSVISACVAQKRTIGLVVAVQNAAVVLGFVLVAFLACFGGMSQLTSLVLFLFQAFWVLVVLLLPKLRK